MRQRHSSEQITLALGTLIPGAGFAHTPLPTASRIGGAKNEAPVPKVRRGFSLPRGVGFGRRPLCYPLSDMSDPSELYVEVRGEEIIVVVPHSTYAATYCRSKDSSSLILTQVSSPDKDDPRSTQTAAQFLGLAWQAANDKARELGWIV